MTVSINFNAPGLQAASVRGASPDAPAAESDGGQKRTGGGDFARLLKTGSENVSDKVKKDSTGTQTDSSGEQVATTTRDDSTGQDSESRKVTNSAEDSHVVALKSPDIDPLPADIKPAVGEKEIRLSIAPASLEAAANSRPAATEPSETATQSTGVRFRSLTGNPSVASNPVTDGNSEGKVEKVSPAAQPDTPSAKQPVANQGSLPDKLPGTAADTEGDSIADTRKSPGGAGLGRSTESPAVDPKLPAQTSSDSRGLDRAAESALAQAFPNPTDTADAESDHTSFLRQLSNARATDNNRSPVADEHSRAAENLDGKARPGMTPASPPPLPNAAEQARSATERLSAEGLVVSPGRDMNRGAPDAIDSSPAGESGKLTGKELPESGKPLPSVLTQSQAQYAPGLVDRVEQMTRSVGNGRQKLAILDGKETGGSDRLTSEGLRLPAAELFSRLMTQAQPLAPTGEVALGTQTSGADSQATQTSQAASLLASVQAGAERSSISRPTPLTGLDSGNGFSIHVQPDNLEWSNQLGNRIRWMSNLNLSSAELKLYPAELGTLEIRIAAEDDQARVSFITSNATAKEIIESSLPRLRELLGQSGLLLEQGDVTHRDSGTSDSRERLPTGNGTFAAADRVQAEASEPSLPLYRRSASENRIDQFA